MTDPFSVLVGAVGLAGAVLKVAQTTENFVKGIRGAPQAVRSLSNEINALHEILNTLDALLQNRNNARNSELARLSPVLMPPLKYCRKSLENVEEELRPFVKAIEGANDSKWRSFQWKYREKDMIALQRNLSNSQIMLSSAIQVRGFNFETASMANSTFVGSDEPVTEYNFGMRRFLLDTESSPQDDFPPASPDKDVQPPSSFAALIESGSQYSEAGPYVEKAAAKAKDDTDAAAEKARLEQELEDEIARMEAEDKEKERLEEEREAQYQAKKKADKAKEDADAAAERARQEQELEDMIVRMEAEYKEKERLEEEREAQYQAKKKADKEEAARKEAEKLRMADEDMKKSRS
ncbi:hypothetical protein ACLMJK_006332 [Lecanora helva]